MFFKRIASLFITVALVCVFNGAALAELFSVSLGVPVYHSFNEEGVKADGMPTGVLAHVKFPIMIGLGIESYQTEIDTGEANIDKVRLKTNMFDIFYLLPVPIVNITLGVGAGNINADSDIYEDSALAYQAWCQAGFPVLPFLDMHLSYHKIFAKLESKDDSISDANFNSDMIAVGIAFVF